MPCQQTLLVIISVVILGIFSDRISLAMDEAADDKSMMEMDEAQADFALDLLRVAAKTDESAIMSPFSISVALGMAYIGAEGSTKEQMTAVLAKGLNVPKFDEYIGNLIAQIGKGANGYTLDTANRLYLQNNFTLKEAFLKAISVHYAGQLQQVNFAENVKVAKEINEWVMKQTRDKIKDLISPDIIEPNTRLILVNAVYFKGLWEKQFKKEQTKNKPFFSAADKQREVEMMSTKSRFPYYEDNDVQVLGMPYNGSEVHMFILLPREKYGLAAVQKKLTGKQLLAYISKSEPTEVIVEVPKFKMEKKFELVNALEQLGMHDAFNGAANFSGICDEALYISDVIHKAFIEVNEEGTEAAAATAIVAVATSLIIGPEPKRFTADHPFLYAIVRRRRILLFTGLIA